MVGSSIYALQKTREAIQCLTTGADLRERLHDAVFHMHILQADEIPDRGLQQKFLSVMEATKSEIPNNIQLSHMTDEAVRDAVRKIVELFEACVALHTKSPELMAKEEDA